VGKPADDLVKRITGGDGENDGFPLGGCGGGPEAVDSLGSKATEEAKGREDTTGEA